MARPMKKGLDYFPLDVDLDDKIEMLQAKYGLIGFGFIIHLWQRIYKNGYFLEWDDRQKLLLRKTCELEMEVLEGIVSSSIAYGIFNKQLYENYSVLTSKGIQERYIQGTQKRKSVDYIGKYLLTNPVDKYPKTVKVYINGVNAHDNEVNSHIYPQSTVEEIESKGKDIESKEHNNMCTVGTQETDCTLLLKKALDTFYKMRAEMGKPAFGQLRETLEGELETLGSDERAKIEIVEQSIQNKWTNFYPLKQLTTGNMQSAGNTAGKNSLSGRLDFEEFERRQFEEIRKRNEGGEL